MVTGSECRSCSTEEAACLGTYAGCCAACSRTDRRTHPLPPSPPKPWEPAKCIGVLGRVFGHKFNTLDYSYFTCRRCGMPEGGWKK